MKDETKYKFSEPIHIMFVYAVQKEPPIINGHQLTVMEQRVLALMVYEYVRQNLPAHLAKTVEESLRARWPDCNWDYERP